VIVLFNRVVLYLRDIGRINCLRMVFGTDTVMFLYMRQCIDCAVIYISLLP
jgi:hypothetical protein